MPNRETWDERYRKDWSERSNQPSQLAPVEFMADNIELLPKGKALDLAMGEGRNSLFLAENGFEVFGVDYSRVAVDHCVQFARQRGLKVNAVVGDLSNFVLPKAEFDVVLNFYFLQRDLITEIQKALRVGGIVLFETFNTEHLKFNPEMNPEFLLQPGELLQLFPDLVTLVYREGVVYDPVTNKGRAVSSLIARKTRRG